MVLAAAVTPFHPEGQIDQPSMVKLIAWLKSSECDGVVLGGTTGEGPSLSVVEKRDLIRLGCAHSLGLKMILGISTNSLSEAIWLVRQAAAAGAYAALVMPPAFFREYGQQGLLSWFEQLLDKADLPILLYNFPKRVTIAFESETVAKLAQHQNMMGLKDSSGERENLPGYARAAPGKKLFVGDETLLVEALRLGWEGTISGSANVIARWLKRVDRCELSHEGLAEANLEFILPTLRRLKSLPQPWTHKSILTALQVIDGPTVRPPLMQEEPIAWTSELDLLRREISLS